MKGKVRAIAVGVAALAVAGLSAMAGSGAALAQGGGGAQPPWYNSFTEGQAPEGGITFYNAEGQVVTGGSITAAGLSAYAVADTADPLAPHTKATLFVYTPVSGANPLTWSGIQLTQSTTYPNTSAPEPISGTTNAVESNNGTDLPLIDAVESYPNTDTSDDGYAGLYDVRLRVSGGTGGDTSEYWDTVISIDITSGTIEDPVAGTWSVDWPDYTQDTTTTLTASPGSPQTTSTPSPITLTANVSPATAGTVTFWTGYGTSSATEVGSAQTVSSTDGTASVTTTPPADATTSYEAVYTPDIGSADIGSTASLNYTVQVPADTTTTTLTETGGGGPAGTPVTFTATVTDVTNSANNPVSAGTVSFYPSGSTTPLGTASATAGTNPATYTLTYTYAAAGDYSVYAVYTPPTGSTEYDMSTSSPVTFAETTPQCTTCTNVATIEGTIPEGTLAIYTPYTATNPLNLGTLALNADGTYYSASASLDSNSADVPTAGTIPDTTFNGITVVDTQAGNIPWTVTALASALSDGGSNPGSTISGENVGITNLVAVPVPSNALTAADLSFTDQPAANPPVAPTDTGDQGLGGTTAHTIVTDSQQADGTIGINGTITLNAPTSTEAGLFTGTITFTISS